VKELKLYGQPNVVIALAANKCDLEKYRVVSHQEGQAYARDNEMSYFETSAKSAHNVRKMFVDLGDSLPPRCSNTTPAATVHCYGTPAWHEPAAAHVLCLFSSQLNVCHARMRYLRLRLQ